MLGDKKPSELDDRALLAAHDHCGQQLVKRNEARLHEKFKKMPFPPPNPAFIEMMNSIELELKKRKLI